jgi:proline dehydrogenase
MKLINYLIIQIIPFLPKVFVRLVASPYIAGITDDEMLVNVQKLNNKGYDVAIDILGEHVKTEKRLQKLLSAMQIYMIELPHKILMLIYLLN